ncbi:MAG: hypothetical protein WC997_01935 [Porticoccaceae bacterium]
MLLERKLLIVVDPTSESHPTIDRVVGLQEAEIPNYQPAVSLLFAVDQTTSDTRADNPAVYCDDSFLHNFSSRLEKLGVTPEIRISWSKDWADSILYNVEAVGASSIMVPHPGATRISDEFWYLIRNSPVPVGIIQDQGTSQRSNILLAMDFQDKGRAELNQRLLEAGKLVASRYDAQLHIANAYGSSETYPDRGRIIAETGLPNENIHLMSGDPGEILEEVSKRVTPDLIMIGATRRTGIKAALRGRKITQMLKVLTQDIFVIV